VDADAALVDADAALGDADAALVDADAALGDADTVVSVRRHQRGECFPFKGDTDGSVGKGCHNK
jgi:hypothetical protein